MSTPLIFLDTETTGLIPGQHTPWEIGYITAELDTFNLVLYVVDEARELVELSQRQLALADPTALQIGGWFDRYDQGVHHDITDVVEYLKERLAKVSERCGGQIPYLVGVNPGFDHAMICENWTAWPDHGEGLWHYHLIDVTSLAAGRLTTMPPYKSSELASALGATVDDTARHTALGDARWAMETYARIYDLEIRR